MSDPLSKVEQRLLDELLTLHARRPAAVTGNGEPVAVPKFRQPQRRSHAIQNLVVLAALVAVAAFLVVRSTGLVSSPALAATPRPLRYMPPGPGAPSGRAVLRHLAATAARQPAQISSRRATYAYVKTVGWYLDISVGSGSSTSDVFPQTTESWLKPNGSGRVINTTGGGSHPTVNRLNVSTGPRLFSLSTNPEVLAGQLAVGHPRTDGPQEQIVAFTDTASQQPIQPAAEATILRLLAKIPGWINSGTVTDRAGRTGVAVSFDSPMFNDRYTLILNPRTGQLLGFEETLLGNPGRIPVPRGAVLAYTTIYSSRYVTNAGSTR